MLFYPLLATFSFPKWLGVFRASDPPPPPHVPFAVCHTLFVLFNKILDY